MVTVAKSFEAPIKLVFPQDLIEHGLGATNMAMLGLGDIVIPGIFVALLLRYDQSLKRNSNFYFWVTFLAYIAQDDLDLGFDQESKKETEEFAAPQAPVQVQPPSIPDYDPQEPFQPGSTPTHLESRFMVWNSVGIVRSFNSEDESSIGNVQL